MSHSRRALFVSYLFPPVGGVGVQRVTKFVKYLPEFGWQSSVLTVSNPSVPLHDESYQRDIPANTIIRRAKTYEPGYALKQAVSADSGSHKSGFVKRWIKGAARSIGNTILQPDTQVLWHRHAFREGLKLLMEVSHDVIVATGPPFSSLLLGAKLARHTGLPLVLDYRDEWDISNAYWENKQQGRLANWIQQRQQAKAMRAADVLLATTPSSARSIAGTAALVGSTALTTFIYNGFDSDDFATSNVPAQRVDYGNGVDRFRLAFIGTLWNLNSIEPVVQAIERLSQSSPHLAAGMELLLAGRRTGDQEEILKRLDATSCAVTRLPFVSHSEAIELMQSADSLLMLNSDRPQTQRIINAKTFEYMAAKRPMFVVAPEGDVWDIVRELPGTVLCLPSQVQTITDGLALAIEQHRCGMHFDDAHWDIGKFHRRELAGRMATLLDHVCLSDLGKKAPSTTPRQESTSDTPVREEQGDE